MDILVNKEPGEFSLTSKKDIYSTNKLMKSNNNENNIKKTKKK